MKKLLGFLLIAMVSTALCCKDPNQKKITPDPSPNPPTPPKPNTTTITAEDLKATFKINKKDMPASMAAKTMKTANLSTGNAFKFTKREIVSYDDKKGEFIMHMEGKKTKTDGSKQKFNNDVSFTEFTHPLEGKIVQSINVHGFELDLSEGIEHNYTLAKYIEELNKNIDKKTMLKSLSFMLSDATTTIEIGTHNNYILKASAKQSTDKKIQIVPKVPYFRLDKGQTEVEEVDSVVSFTTLSQHLKKDYFDEDDVFQYVLSKVDEATVINVDPTIFASSFYAFAKEANSTPSNIFSESFKDKIKSYKDIYKNAGTDKHLKLDIDYGIYQPSNGGVDADDYKGSLKIKLCIATSDQISQQNEIVAIKEIAKAGFASIPDNVALKRKEHLFFNLIPKAPPLDATKKQAWENKAFAENYSLLKVSETGVAIVDTTPFNAADVPFNLFVNSSDPDLSSHLGCAYFGSSKTKNEKIIWIERIQIKKTANSKAIDVLVTLKGNMTEPLKITVEPY